METEKIGKLEFNSDGEKIFISNAETSDLIATFENTEEGRWYTSVLQKAQNAGIAVFEEGRRELSIVVTEDKITPGNFKIQITEYRGFSGPLECILHLTAIQQQFAKSLFQMERELTNNDLSVDKIMREMKHAKIPGLPKHSRRRY